MKAFLLLVISCFSLFWGGRGLASEPVAADCPVVHISHSVEAFTKHAPIKRSRVKKASSTSHQQQESFTEADEDFNLGRHLELQARDALLFTVAFVWTYRPIYIEKPLPFSWQLAQTIPCKYIFQRVLRI